MEKRRGNEYGRPSLVNHQECWCVSNVRVTPLLKEGPEENKGTVIGLESPHARANRKITAETRGILIEVHNNQKRESDNQNRSPMTSSSSSATATHKKALLRYLTVHQ